MFPLTEFGSISTQPPESSLTHCGALMPAMNRSRNLTSGCFASASSMTAKL